MAKSTATIDEVWEHFKKGIIDSMNRHIPTRLSSPRNTLPWIDKKIRKMLKRKLRLYKQAKRITTGLTINTPRKWFYAPSGQQNTTSSITSLKRALINNDTKPFWRYIKSRKQDNIGVSPLKDKGALHSDSQEKANILLRQFQSVFTKDGTNENLPDVEHQLNHYTPIDVSGVSKLIQNLKTSKASGLD